MLMASEILQTFKLLHFSIQKYIFVSAFLTGM